MSIYISASFLSTSSVLTLVTKPYYDVIYILCSIYQFSSNLHPSLFFLQTIPLSLNTRSERHNLFSQAEFDYDACKMFELFKFALHIYASTHISRRWSLGSRLRDWATAKSSGNFLALSLSVAWKRSLTLSWLGNQSISRQKAQAFILQNYEILWGGHPD